MKCNRHIAGEATDNPYCYLAMGIIHQALLDLRFAKKHGYIYDLTTRMITDGSDVMSFLRSQWCADLIGWADVDQDWLIEQAERICT